MLDKVFNRIGVVGGACESHGVLCGLLCARGEIARDDWLMLMTDEATLPVAGDRHDDDLAMVSRLYSETVEDLQDPDTLFSPLLPDDGEPLDRRAGALADWCRGFVFGLGAGGIEDYALLPEDIREITSDIIDISRASSETDHGEEDEAAWLELVEYLRAGVTLVFETLEAERGSANDERTLH